MLSMKSVEPIQLTLDARFKFKCHKGIGCFTKCCSDIDILLTPYDIIRLKKRMGLSSGEFLTQYIIVKINEKTSHPFVFLKMNEDVSRNCPFVSPDGCAIYSDRPANCRYYPVGQASLKKMSGKMDLAVTEEFYFFVKEEHCLGFKEDKEWTVRDWRDDQGLDIYDEMNRGWKEILFRKNFPGSELDEKRQKAFYMACYDVDRFKRFIFDSRFLDTFDVDGKKIEKMRNEELELMKFGFDYTKYILGIEETFKKK